MAISTVLHSFLSAENRSTAVDARIALGDPDPDDRAAIASIMNRWDDSKAVANLLFHPELLATEDRVKSLVRGLEQEEDAYLRLAAIVGVQDIDCQNLESADRTKLKTLLMSEIQEGSQVLAARASVSVLELLQPEDVEQLLDQLNKPDDLLRHNALVALVKVFGVKQALDLIYQAACSGAIDESSRTYSERCFAELSELCEGGLPISQALLMSSLGAPSLAYIPDYLD
ncbi:hypothetical protein [Roseofilum sp. Belize Diploria]|uniref:hypothetical protein n=1 Tax=Roseofilum sp. Belize Diploria TaxID=2821501 RepID=UPI001B151C45|nr:hypothetical protein [Roseofilum sp. Belize Diploria]MBP0009359.1 hypothetical protein [Roseofilum sp. Belize Diploria]